MPTSKPIRSARRKPGASPQKTPIRVGASMRAEQPVELAGKVYQAFCPKRSKFMKVFKPEQIAKLMQLEDDDPLVRDEAERYTCWTLNLIFGEKAGAELYTRLRSDDITEDLDEDMIGEVLMHLCVIWTPDLAQNAQAMKQRMEPLTEKMETMAEEMRSKYATEDS